MNPKVLTGLCQVDSVALKFTCQLGANLAVCVLKNFCAKFTPQEFLSVGNGINA